MSYFHWVSFVLGVLMGLSGLWLTASPSAYRKLAQDFIAKKRAGWVMMVSIAWLLWVGYSTLLFFASVTPVSTAVTFLMGLSLIKIYFIVFRYETYRAFAGKFLILDDSILRIFGLIYLTLGVLLIALACPK